MKHYSFPTSSSKLISLFLRPLATAPPQKHKPADKHENGNNDGSQNENPPQRGDVDDSWCIRRRSQVEDAGAENALLEGPGRVE
jgi:hypothetical protein